MYRLIFIGFLLAGWSAHATIHRVNLNPLSTADFQSLQNAVNLSANGDTLLLESYFESDLYDAAGTMIPAQFGVVTVDKELHFIGEGYFKDLNYPELNTNLNNPSIAQLDFISGSDGSTVDKCTIFNLTLNNTTDIRIERNFIQRCSMDLCSGILFAQNYVYNNVSTERALFIEFTQNVTIRNNFISQNPDVSPLPLAIFEQNNNGLVIDHNVVLHGDMASTQAAWSNNIFGDGRFVLLQNALLARNIFAVSNPIQQNAPDGSSNNQEALTNNINLTGIAPETLFEDPDLQQDAGFKIVPGSDASGFGTNGTDVGMYDGTSPYEPSGDIQSKPQFTIVEYLDCFTEEIFLPLTLQVVSLNGDFIINGEYFVDSDPGQGLGINFNVTPDSELNIFEAVDLTFYGVGVHILGIRFVNESGNISSILELPFKIEEAEPTPEFLGVEVWFDDDPGIGNGTFIPDQGQNFTTGEILETIPVTQLTPGIHNLGIRPSDASGDFGTTFITPILVFEEIGPAPALSSAEFFFDDDPGFGNGGIFETDETGTAFITIPLTQITPGIHNLFFRISDESGDWSTSQIQPILIVEEARPADDLIGYEYFFDDEPGIGNATLVDVQPGTTFDGTVSIPVDGLAVGEHTVFIRFIDANGDVSTTQYRFITIDPNSEDCADFNSDGTINSVDLLAFLGFFGTTNPTCETGDFNGDGLVNSVDLLAFLSLFGQ